jgi:hypothetical protein
VLDTVVDDTVVVDVSVTVVEVFVRVVVVPVMVVVVSVTEVAVAVVVVPVTVEDEVGEVVGVDVALVVGVVKHGNSSKKSKISAPAGRPPKDDGGAVGYGTLRL